MSVATLKRGAISLYLFRVQWPVCVHPALDFHCTQSKPGDQTYIVPIFQSSSSDDTSTELIMVI
jgi:hypothetical protein